MQEALAKGDLQRAEQAQAARASIILDASPPPLKNVSSLARSQMALAESLEQMDLENEQPSIAKLDQRLSDIQKAANNQKKQEELLQKIQQEYAVEAPELASEAEALQRLAAQARSRKRLRS